MMSSGGGGLAVESAASAAGSLYSAASAPGGGHHHHQLSEFLRPLPPRYRTVAASASGGGSHHKEDVAYTSSREAAVAAAAVAAASYQSRPLFHPQLGFSHYTPPYLYQPYYHPPALPQFKVPPQQVGGTTTVSSSSSSTSTSSSTAAQPKELTLPAPPQAVTPAAAGGDTPRTLKHRILKKRTRATGISLASFTKGSLVQLASGELRRVEEMTTEDFVSSADASPALRLDPSTVVRIERADQSTAVITLMYGPNKSQVEYEASLEQPFFVLGGSWASCSPERTLEKYGLKCSQLQVGDTCISLSPRTDGRKRRWSAPDDIPEPMGSTHSGARV